jgi:hypothetical protein
MNFDFSQALAGAIAPALPPSKFGTEAIGVASPLIFQMSLLPQSIIPANYVNAQSSANPGGDYVSLYRFRELVNNVPEFARNFTASGYFVESLIKNMLFGATVPPNDKFVQMSFANAQENFTDYKLSGMSGIPGSWRPVYANPYNWAEQLSSGQSLMEMTLDLSKSSNFGPQTYTTIGTPQNDLVWSVGNSSTGQAISPGTQIRFVRFKYMKIDLQRPWLDLEVFNLKGWTLQGQSAGFYSSGSSVQNSGILPLLPISLIIGTEVQIWGQIAPSDQQFIQRTLGQNPNMRLGVFPFSKYTFGQGNAESSMQSEGFFTMAWLSNLLPLAPSVAG